MKALNRPMALLRDIGFRHDRANPGVPPREQPE